MNAPLNTARMIVADPEMFEDFVVDAAQELLDAYDNPAASLEQAAAELHIALNGHL
jgi:hypothetical protein